ncbi:MAG: VIT1/CCC1 transporter family protein [Thermoleophilia bacterium]
MDLPPESSPGRHLPPEPPVHDIELSPARERELEEKRRTYDASQLFAEKERIASRGRIRQFMFGSLDGLLVPLGVVSGVAGGTSDSKIVVIAGVAEAFAGALSMGAGEYLSGKSEAQVQQAAIRDEEEEITAIPDIEKYEIELLFEHEGLSHDDAGVVADKVTSSHRSWVNTMVEKELGLSTEPEGSLAKDSLAMGASYLLASLVPLGPYLFLPVRPAFALSVALTILALLVIGTIKGRLARMSIWRSALEVVLIGVASAAGGYLLGTLVPHLIGR